MKAMVYKEYGAPEVLKMQNIPKPSPKDKEVLIKIYATSVTTAETAFRKGKPFVSRLGNGLIKPKKIILGVELAGEIEAVGSKVTRFKKGDQVFGESGAGFGAYAEYICLPEEGEITLKPEDTTYEEAAAACDGVLTALPFLRDNAKIQSGQHILINGASGSIGTFAVQLAKYYGAVVTGVCSTSNLELVQSLGADKVIDYTKEDFTKTKQAYDIIFDVVNKRSFTQCKNALKPGGIYLTTYPTGAVLFQMLWTSIAGNKRAQFVATGLRPSNEKVKDLMFLKELMEEGKIKTVIDRCYPLDQVAEAHRYVDKGHKKGNVVIKVGQSDQTF